MLSADAVSPCGALACAVDGAPSPEEAVIRKAEAERLRQAVGQLPRRERTLLLRHYFQGDRFDHVAARLGISKSWASRLHRRALRSLSSHLEAPSGVENDESPDSTSFPLAA